MNESTPTESTHGHTVLDWLAATPMTRAALAVRVARELGAAPAFHTCDQRGLSLDDLLELLARRGKIVRDGDAWSTDRTQVCDHG